MNLLKGSVWRKWDLHIHTPKSIENNFGGDTPAVWEKFITALENLPEDVKVIGINDYYFIDGYEEVMKYKMKGRLPNIEKIFPVLEFRIDTFSSASQSTFQKVNLHILFDINEKHWEADVKKIKDEFIGIIPISSLDTYATKMLSREHFTEGGNGDIKTGFQELVPSTRKVLNIINSDTWRKRTFTLLGYKEWNNLEKGAQLKQTKDTLYNSVNAFFTASPEDKLNARKETLEIFGNKPLLYSADIHRFDLFEPTKYQCFTWIKADPTFQGLRQITYEPQERVKLQPQNPDYDQVKSNILDTIKIIPSTQSASATNWFAADEIPLNRGLVSIIGEKGSGKTALLDLLAISNDEGIYEQNPNAPYSFYNRAKDKLGGTTICIKSQAGGESTYSIDGRDIRPESNKDANVRYLSLKELEGYCDSNEKFQQFMRNIIHSRYRNLASYETQSKEYISSIRSLITQLVASFNIDKAYPEYKNLIQKKETELDLHLQSEPKVKTNITPEDTEEYKQLISQTKKNTALIDQFTTHIRELHEFNSWIKQLITQSQTDLLTKIKGRLTQLTYSDKALQPDSYAIQIQSNIEEIISNRIVAVETMLNSCIDTKDKLEAQITPLETKHKNLKSEMQVTTQWITTKSTIETELNKYKEYLKGLDKNRDHITELQSQLCDIYKKLLINKISQKVQYEEIKKELQTKDDISFDVKIQFNTENFWLKEDQIINHGSGYSQEAIHVNLNTNLLQHLGAINLVNADKDPTSDITTIVSHIHQIFDPTFAISIFGDKKNTSLLKKANSLDDYYNWLLDDYYEVNYFIQFKSRPLETLSPGQKGLVLMKIFLMLDKDTKPLLIDQPEDNLDNKSVYDDLVTDFKEIKQRRQIIIATHNPNLVVNTDSEQVIVAHFEDAPSTGSPRIKYTSGSLEDPAIKDLVCKILEGGDRAFVKREIRYDLSTKL